MFLIGQQVRRRADGLIQTVFDVDSINSVVHVNWIRGPRDQMHKEQHSIHGKPETWAIEAIDETAGKGTT